ncbi:MAG: AmmeMemoRadiSam system protein B [Verrucomicrobiales bacterium]|jgi:AmmeMemoRadiSam system protein B|nr:AmmeMemoRadiSam system protein B [Verrucomicrobiales bacterium]
MLPFGVKSLAITAAFAGQSYPADRGKLLRLFQRELERADAVSASLLLVPHIDFPVNLSLYARAYAHLLNTKRFPKIFYLLGVGHQCPHEFSAVAADYLTPLGRTTADRETLAMMERATGLELSRSPSAWRREHSIEFVVVWLQALRDLYFPNAEFKIVPVLLGGLHDTIVSGRLPAADHPITRFGRAVADSFKQHADGDAALIASIDGCHVGPRFDHHFPADGEVQATVQNWEAELWRRCRSDRLNDFIRHLHEIENAFYFDGVGALTLLLRNFTVSARREGHDLWYEAADQSFVTFSGGYFS